MTRESKLGLLIGGALILLVCILVSDLKSTVQKDQPADLANDQSSDTLLDRMAMAVDPDYAARRQTPVHAGPTLVDGPQDPANADSAEALGFDNPNQEAIPGGADNPTTTPTAGRFTLETEVPAIGDIPGFNNPVHRQTVVETPNQTTRQTAKTIKVEKGDNLTKLAQRHLGDGSRWRELLDANKNILDDPKKLQAGMTLALPTLAPARPNLAARQPAGSAASATTSSNRSTTATPPNRGPKTVVLGQGESLSDIAQKHMGSASKWNALYKANRSVIGDDPNKVRPGTKLIIPAD